METKACTQLCWFRIEINLGVIPLVDNYRKHNNHKGYTKKKETD